LLVAIIAPVAVQAQDATIGLPDSASPTLRTSTLGERVRSWWQRPERQQAMALRWSLRTIDDAASPGVVVMPPFIWGLAAAAQANGPARGARRTTEAVLLGAATTAVLKAAFGRARPFVNGRSDHWSAWRGNEGRFAALPSGHTTVAFAAAATWVAEARGHAVLPVAIGATSFAVGAGLARTFFDQHWLTDVLAGAAVGTLSAVAVQAAHRTWGHVP
jgi:membrane-associated phospholipid phosphatase